MYITEEMISEIASLYGQPFEEKYQFDVNQIEYDLIKRSQRDGRNHDVTIYISNGNRLVLMAKHGYPEHLFRAPSGGIELGESIIDGINREVAEETGCKILVKQFLLKTSVCFKFNNEFINWRSFIFLADYISGDFDFTDHKEIRAVKLADWDEFISFGKIMRRTDSGGFHYRADLHDTVVHLIKNNQNS